MEFSENSIVTEMKLKRIAALSAVNPEMVFTHVIHHDSVAGAEAAAIIYSLIETCKYHQVEPYDWLRYVLQNIPACQTLVALEALLPFNIDKKLLANHLI